MVPAAVRVVPAASVAPAGESAARVVEAVWVAARAAAARAVVALAAAMVVAVRGAWAAVGEVASQCLARPPWSPAALRQRR